MQLSCKNGINCLTCCGLKSVRAYLLVILLLLAAGFSASAQEVLRASKVQAKSSRRPPSMGLPVRHDGQIDPVVWCDAGYWKGAESLKTSPFWVMKRGLVTQMEYQMLQPVLALCEQWASERPKNTLEMVWGPFRDGWFVAICKKTTSNLGWKSIGFIIPREGIDPAKSIYAYSKCVNWIEHHIAYNLFPKLPAHLQEIIEEMSSFELLSPVQEFDPGLDEGPEREIDYDWEADVREAME